MKDLTHYFTDSPKSCETSSINSKLEVIQARLEIPQDHNMESTAKENTNLKDNKVKISHTNIENKILNTVNNDIDPIPDPLINDATTKIIIENGRSEKHSATDALPKIIDKKISSQADSENINIDGVQRKTAINITSTRLEEDDVSSIVIHKGIPKESEISNDVPKTISENDNSLIVNDSSDKVRDINILVENKSEEPNLNDVTSGQATNNIGEREESNAFELLMTRSKPMHFNSLPCSSTQEIELITKKTDESKAKLKRYKERLTKLADRKGYAKRKLEELEEAEKIERRVEKRMKMFRQDVKKDCSNGSDDIIPNQKQTSSNLLNYFSKTTPEQQQKNIMLSTMVVEAQVHVSENTTVPITSKIEHQLVRDNKGKKSKSETILSKADDIQIIRSENLCSQPVTKQQQLSMHRRSKPQWSLRIKLQSYSEDESLPETDSVSDDDLIFSPRSLSKLKKYDTKRKSEESLDTFVLPDSIKEEKRNKHEKKISNKKIMQKNEETAFKKSDEQNSNNADAITHDILSKNVKDKKSDLFVESITQKRKIYKFKKLDVLKSSNGEIIKRQNKRYNSKLNGDVAETTKLNNIDNKKCTTISKKSSHCKDDDAKNVNFMENKCKFDDDLIIEDHLSDDQNNVIIEEDLCILNRKSQEKLAPLFTKRRKPDPAVIAARRLFLQSDTSDNKGKAVERISSINDLSPSVLPFPMISHVTQLNAKSNFDESNINDNYSLKICDKYVPLLDVSQLKFITNLKKPSTDLPKTVQQPVEANFEEVLTEIGKHCTDVMNMWKAITCIANGETKKQSTNTKDRKEKSCDKKETRQEIQNCIWISKYKPISTKDVVGNEEAAEKLRNWLDKWKLPLVKEDGSSGDEFYSSDCSYSSNNDSNQVAVLMGPYGSGKTASVYAVAEELGYRVLEVNASSRRTGRKILKDLQEATKSHRIKKDINQTTIAPILKQHTKKKISQNSLILIEDVDVIFEEDEGFISATFQLASNTKRPIVMTCRNTCPHLNKMAPQQLQIYFQAAVGTRVSALLELISLAETGWRLPQSCLKELIKDGDLRKALLQLQYLLLSGQPQKQSLCSNNLRTSLWRDTQLFLYEPVIKTNRRNKNKKHSKPSNHSSTNKYDVTGLNNLADNLDSIRLISSLIDVEDPTSTSSDIKSAPSLSLEENTEHYSSLKTLSSEIAEWLSHEVLHRKQMIDCREFHDQISERQSLTKQVNAMLSLTLSQVSPWMVERRVISVDYLPCVRAICRAESVRSSTKRGNRFYHYLHNLNLPSTVTSPNILAAACKTMQEPKKHSKH